MQLSNSSNREDFKPTYLYVKRCNHCGLKYFGKTTSKDPSSYCGSGSYWKNHCEKYGWENVETIKVKLFKSKDSLVKAALRFSEERDIVNARMESGKKAWANLRTPSVRVPENRTNPTTFNGQFFIDAVFDGAGSAGVKLSRPQFWRKY